MSELSQIKQLRSIQLGPVEVIAEETKLEVMQDGEDWIRMRIEDETDNCEGIFADSEIEGTEDIKKWWWLLTAKDAEALVQLLSSFDSVSAIRKERLKSQGCDDLEEMQKRIKLSDAKILELHREMAELRRQIK